MQGGRHLLVNNTFSIARMGMVSPIVGTRRRGHSHRRTETQTVSCAHGGTASSVCSVANTKESRAVRRRLNRALATSRTRLCFTALPRPAITKCFHRQTRKEKQKSKGLPGVYTKLIVASPLGATTVASLHMSFLAGFGLRFQAVLGTSTSFPA